MPVQVVGTTIPGYWHKFSAISCKLKRIGWSEPAVALAYGRINVEVARPRRVDTAK